MLKVRYSGKYQNGSLRHPYYWSTESDKGVSIDVIDYANWNIVENRKRLFDELTTESSFESREDYYQLTLNKIDAKAGRGLMRFVYNGSIYKAMMDVYPDHKWLIWKFEQKLPVGFWETHSHQVQYMDWLGDQLGIKTKEDWYDKKWEQLTSHGNRLLDKYNNSPSVLLKAVYPEHDWQIEKFRRTPLGYWEMIESHLRFIGKITKEMNIQRMEDWYQVTNQDVKGRGGQRLLHYYDGSIINVLKKVFPEHTWLTWNFKFIPKNHWKSKENQLEFMEWLGGQLNHKTMDDWYSLSTLR